MTPLLTTLERTTARASDKAEETVLCRCRRARLGLLGPHVDHRAELERLRRAGRVPDEAAFVMVRS